VCIIRSFRAPQRSEPCGMTDLNGECSTLRTALEGIHPTCKLSTIYKIHCILMPISCYKPQRGPYKIALKDFESDHIPFPESYEDKYGVHCCALHRVSRFHETNQSELQLLRVACLLACLFASQYVCATVEWCTFVATYASYDVPQLTCMHRCRRFAMASDGIVR